MIKQIIKSVHISLIFRIILAIIFIYSGLEKIANPAKFAATVQNYHIIPIEMTNLVAIILPWVEFYCGIFIFFALFRQSSAALLSGLIIIFIVALSSAMLRGLDIDCGCFGGETNVSWSRIVEDLILLTMSLHLLFIPSPTASLDKYLSKFIKKKL